MLILHVSWESFSEGRGLLGLRFNGDYMEMRQLAGKAPSPTVAGTAVMFATREAINRYPELKEMLDMETSYEKRKSPWKIVRREGMSGCKDYKIRYIRDIHMHDAPLGGKMHVSCFAKLNEGFRGWLGDFVPLVTAAINDFPGLMDTEYEVRWPQIDTEEYSSPEEYVPFYEALGMC